MATRDTKMIRAKRCFVEEILDKIIESEKKRGIEVNYPMATEVLRLRIIKAGGLKE